MDGAAKRRDSGAYEESGSTSPNERENEIDIVLHLVRDELSRLAPVVFVRHHEDVDFVLGLLDPRLVLHELGLDEEGNHARREDRSES